MLVPAPAPAGCIRTLPAGGIGGWGEEAEKFNHVEIIQLNAVFTIEVLGLRALITHAHAYAHAHAHAYIHTCIHT